MQRVRANKNNRIDPDPLLPDVPIKPKPEPNPGPLGRAKVARGRSVHVPTGIKKVVGTRLFEKNGVVMYADVYAQDIHVAQPGEVVELPVAEIERLISLGFLQSIDDQPAKGMKVRGRPETGIKDDPRLTGKPMNNLTNATNR